METMAELELVIQNMVDALEAGRGKIRSIIENIRSEQESVLSRLIGIKEDNISIVTSRDRLEREEKLANRFVRKLKAEARHFSENELQIALEELQHLQTEQKMLRDREKYVKNMREQLQNVLGSLNEAGSRAKKLDSQALAALQLLHGGLRGLALPPDELQLSQQIALRIIQAQEEERLRLAREIHDGPAQSMAGVIMRAEICERLMDLEPAKVTSELRDIKEMLKESLQEVRKIIFDLRPMVLEDLGVIPTLRRFMAELQKRTDLRIELIVLGGEENRFDSNLEVAIFRIVQEALNNASKHAKAERCVIKLGIMAGSVNISIADDGRGFDPDDAASGPAADCFGLLGMKERVDLLKGSIKIESKAEKGTEIRVSIPVKGVMAIDSKKDQNPNRR